MHEEQLVIKDIKVIGVEKPQKGKLQQHFEYVIRVSYADGHEHIIFRRYSMLFDFHSVLKEVVKEGYGSVIVLPELPVYRFQHFGRKFLRLGMNKEFHQMTDFCQKIILLPKFLSEKDIILKFFDQLGTDIAHAESYQEEPQKGELPRDQGDIPTPPSPTEVLGGSQDNDNQYRSIAEFEAVGTGELSVICDEIVTVIEKNSSGWWLISNTTGATGFTPATFLEPLEEKAGNEEEWVEVEGPHNIYTAVKDYEAQCPDEISFKAGEELEVTSMSNFGWWKVRRRNEVGLCPASSLTTKETLTPADSNYNDDAAMNEFRESILHFSKKSSTRETPPRKSSTKSNDDNEFSEPGHFYGNLQRPAEPERFSPGDVKSTVKYTKIIPKHLRQKEANSENDSIKYVNVPVIKDGAPHYFYNSSGQKSEAINVHVLRKNYQGNGFSLQQGDLVQVIAVMPDGCHWKVATMSPPFKDGLVPSDLLCPELPNHMEEPLSPSETTGFAVVEGNMWDRPEPVKVLPRFTQPPSVRKPIPVPRTGAKSPVTGSSKGLAIIAVEDFFPPQNDLLSFKKGDSGRLINEAASGWWFIELKGFEGWVPTAYWRKVKLNKDINDRTNSNLSQMPPLTVWDKSQWFCGKMSRQQCEDRFAKSGKHLEFIVRESIQRVGSYVLSIKFNDKVHHFPIEKAPSGKLNIGKLSFDQLSEIVTHYSVQPLFYTDNRQPVSLGNPLTRT